MSKEIFHNWTTVTKNVNQPLQSLVELNLKTLQKFSYLRPNDLASIKGAEDLLEKQMNVMLENGHNVINYMKESFDIFEKTLTSLNPNDLYTAKNDFMKSAAESMKDIPVPRQARSHKTVASKKKTTLKTPVSTSKSSNRKRTSH